MNPLQAQPIPGAMPETPQGIPFMPEGVPPDEGTVGEPVSEEQKQELAELMSNIKAAMEKFQAIQFAASNKTDILRQQILGKVFEKMQLIGVDLNDQAAVADFIDGIRQNSPELAEQFEAAMNVLIGEDESAEEYGNPQDLEAPVDLGSDPRGSNEMNNENISQDSRGLSQTSIG